MRMICMYPYINSTDHSVFAPLPDSLKNFNYISDIQLKDLEKKQTKSGTNQSIIPKNTDFVIGNVIKSKNKLLIPLCKTVINESNDENYFNKYQCTLLNTTSPTEYMSKWVELGCPYSINGNLLNVFKPSSFDEIKFFGKNEIPDYFLYVKKNSGITPISKKIFGE